MIVYQNWSFFDVSAGQNTILTEPKERVNYNVHPYEGIYFHIIFTFYGGAVKGLSRY